MPTAPDAHSLPSQPQQPVDEVARLREQLAEARETLKALADGRVDALVMAGPRGQQRVYTLESADQPYRLFVEQMHEGAVTLAVDDTILYCNRRFAEMLGLPLERVMGASMSSLITTTDTRTYHDLRERGFAAGAKGECGLRNHSGRVVPVLLSFNPLPASEDEARCCVVVTDLTEQERSKEVIAAKEAAEAASLAKDRFLAVLSHELRTPLTPIVMTIASLELDPDVPTSARDDLAMIRRNIELETKLIDDLLDLSRVTSGKLRLRLEPVRVHDVLRNVVGICAADIQQRGLKFELDAAAGDDPVNADPARLQQVFWNLIKNAIKFTPPGGGITVRTRDTGAGHVHVEVQDTGLGIAKDSLSRIFNAFEQADPTITRQFGGLGLGLAITKAVLDAHGASIEAASEGPGQGSTFSVRFPLASAHGKAGAGHPASGPGQSTGERLRLLLVEDHPDTAKVLSRLLQHTGYSVRTAGSVAAALQLADAEPFDLLVSDVGLPDATGYELMTELRRRRPVRGIAMSGYGMESDMQKSRDAGFAEHLVKPVNFAQLQGAIRRVTANAESAP